MTDRECEVLQLLVKGFPFAEIGGLLQISAHTLTSHLKRIYQKLEVRSRAEAVYEAIGLGLVRERGEVDAPRDASEGEGMTKGGIGVTARAESARRGVR